MPGKYLASIYDVWPAAGHRSLANGQHVLPLSPS